MKREAFDLNIKGDNVMEKILEELFGGIYTRSELEELRESTLLMDAMAKKECFCKPVGGMEEWAKEEGNVRSSEKICCDWYHGTWQYMRLLNMVAVPRWYPFYMEVLSEALRKKPDAKVMISACADLGMLHTLHHAVEAADAHPTIVIYDICNTPLKNSGWYAKKHNFTVECRCENIITADIEKSSFDLITTDEFLTVLQKPYKPLIIEKWKKILKPEGTLVTTAMIGGPTTPELREGYARRAHGLYETYGEFLFPNHWHSDEMTHQLFRQFNCFADFHTRHMIRDEAQIRFLFKEFKYLLVQPVTTPGECVNPTDSFQIVARVGG
jgi:2-polyprenyl-3-methyl-5-hydroxy-6-metoxy-1,4-benzoquinol methylase